MLAAITPGFLTGGSAAKTYADFQAHIATLATGGALAWNSTATTSVGVYRTTAAAATGGMTGSPFYPEAAYGLNSAVARIIQHSMPNQTAFNLLVSGGLEVLFQVATKSAGACAAVDRNGFLSSTQASGTKRACSRVLYWVSGVGAFEIDPQAGTGPTPYTIPEPVTPVADILLDFVNGTYRVDGTTYATAALAGFTGTGTFDATGYTATGTQSISGAISLPGDFAVFAEFSSPASASGAVFQGSVNGVPGVQFGGGLYSTSPAITGGTIAACTRVALGRAGGVAKVSYDNAATVTGGTLSAPGSKTLFIGNAINGANPWGSPIKKIAIYKQTLTDAQFQALS